MSYSPPSHHTVNTNAKIRILLPKLDIHRPNSVYVAGFYAYAILTCQVHVFVYYIIQTTHFFTLKTTDYLALPHPMP